ncbi:MAG: protein-export chaperone SecB [Pseudomonadota bacterium]
MTDAPANPTPPADAGVDQQPVIRVLGQYLKDLSFENPGAPASLRGQGQPQIRLQIDVRARAVEENAYEVELLLNAEAEREGAKVFIAELSYAGLFQIENVDDRAREPFLLIEAPRIIFPFARRILSDATRDGGFPPLMLEPVDFAALYRQRLAQAQQQAQSQTVPDAPNGGGAA